MALFNVAPLHSTTNSPLQILVYPGENIELEAVALDELGVATSAAFTLSDDSMITNNGSQDEVCDHTHSELVLLELCFN